MKLAKKVLLVDPTYNPGNVPPNLGLGHIEAKLIAYNISCLVADFVVLDEGNLFLKKFWDLEAEFVHKCLDLSNNVDVVYISGSHGMEMKPYAMFPRIRAIAAAIRSANRKIKIIFGGALANYYVSVLKFKSEFFYEFGIDEIVTGQEANAVSRIVSVIGNSDSQTPNVNSIVMPEWKSWDLNKYPDYISAMMNLGCPFTCSFCFEGKIYDPSFKQMQVIDIPRWIDLIQLRRNVRSVMIEGSIAISLPWFTDLMDVMSDTGLTWAIYARSNELVKYGDRLAALSKSGCRSVIIGIESFDDVLHVSTNKKITTNQSLRALEMCAEAGVSVQGCMILGFPDDTLGVIERRIDQAQTQELGTYRWHFLQPDWCNLPPTIRGLDGVKSTDILDVQVSLPDSCIPEYLAIAPPMAIYDEHLLIRSLPYYQDVPRLVDFGYNGMPNFRVLMQTIQPLITRMKLPTNEDQMYPLLFEPIRL